MLPGMGQINFPLEEPEIFIEDDDNWLVVKLIEFSEEMSAVEDNVG